MLQELYWERLQRFDLPFEEDTLMFAKDFTSAHSWYKHLDWTEPTEFIFFISPSTGEWSYTMPTNYHSESDWFNGETIENEAELQTDKNHYSYFLPPEIAKLGSIGLTAHIHFSFGNSELFRQQHNAQFFLLKQHLFEIRQSILDFMFKL
jgi:hypothetical protein